MVRGNRRWGQKRAHTCGYQGYKNSLCSHLRLGAREIAAEDYPRLAVEIGRLDDQRITLPMTQRVPHPQTYAVREMWTSIHVDGTNRLPGALHDDHLRGLTHHRETTDQVMWYTG